MQHSVTVTVTSYGRIVHYSVIQEGQYVHVRVFNTAQLNTIKQTFITRFGHSKLRIRQTLAGFSWQLWLLSPQLP